MSIVESIESGVLPIELREALRTLLSQHNQPYLDIPSTDGLGLCISTCFADFRRHVEAEYQVKLGSQLKVPANYTINGRRRLPDSGGRLKYQDGGTQTEPGTAMYTATQSQLRSETPTATAQIESAPEARRRRGKGGRIPVICSSSSDTDRVVNPRSSQQSHARPRQGESPLPAVYRHAKYDQHLYEPPLLHLAHVRGRERFGSQLAPSTALRI